MDSYDIFPNYISLRKSAQTIELPVLVTKGLSQTHAMGRHVFQIRSVCPNNIAGGAGIISVRENLWAKHPASFSPGLWVTRGHLRHRGSPWSVTVGAGDCRLGSEIRYRAVLWAQTGVKDCVVEEERESYRRGGRWTMSHPRPSLTVYLAHTSGRRGRSERHLRSPQFGTRRSNKVLLQMTGQSGRLSLRRSLIALDLLHLTMDGERISVVATSLSLRFFKAADAADIYW